METLTFTSMLAGNADVMYARLAQYLATAVGTPVTFAAPADWRARQEMLDSGSAHLAPLCGWPYSLKTDHLSLLVAPIMTASRYGGKPVYFSDVIVRADSAIRSFSDLRGLRWAFNEKTSFSGHAIVCAHLDMLNELHGYFGSALQSGSHAQSIHAVLDNRADGAAIDSTVLERELSLNPTLAPRLRSVAALGPSPIPPIVVRRDVPEGMVEKLRVALLNMASTNQGRSLLADAGIARYARVADVDYDDIRRKAACAQWVTLTPEDTDRSFAAAPNTIADLAVMHELQMQLVQAVAAGASAGTIDLISKNGRPSRLVISRPADLESNAALSVVGFFGQRNWQAPESVVAEIGATDVALVREMSNHEHVVAYCSAELADGNWGNLVIMSAVAGLQQWRDGARHQVASQQLAPVYYNTVRLHNGVLQHGLSSQQIQLQRTKMFDYRSGQYWSATREMPR